MQNCVIFDKPNHLLLQALGKKCIDMHFHSRYSDTTVRIRSIIGQAAKKGIGVSITDHNEIAGSIKASKNKKNIMIIPGIEVSCIDGPHILLYFYSFDELKEFFEKKVLPYRGANPYMQTNIRTEDLVNSTTDCNCIRVAAHPFGYMISNSGLSKAIKKACVAKEVMEKIDGLETINGAVGRRLNRAAVEEAIKLGKHFTGGSDGHSLFQLGSVLTVSDADSVEGFLNNIKKNNNLVIGREFGIIPKIVPQSHMLKTHAIDYTVPTIKLQSRLLFGRAKGRVTKLGGAFKKRLQRNGIAKKAAQNGIVKKFGRKKKPAAQSKK